MLPALGLDADRAGEEAILDQRPGGKAIAEDKDAQRKQVEGQCGCGHGVVISIQPRSDSR